jgi:hypothetical protein
MLECTEAAMVPIVPYRGQSGAVCAEGLGIVLLRLVQVAQRDTELRALFVQQLESLQAVHLHGTLLCAYGCMEACIPGWAGRRRATPSAWQSQTAQQSATLISTHAPRRTPHLPSAPSHPTRLSRASSWRHRTG